MAFHNELIQAGKVIDRQGYTKAGRALAKHGGRRDSVFPKPTGRVAQINDQGQRVLEKILSDPDRQVYRLPNGNVKVFSSDGRGVHFKQDNSFIGFIEKQYEK